MRLPRILGSWRRGKSVSTPNMLGLGSTPCAEWPRLRLPPLPPPRQRGGGGAGSGDTPVACARR